MTKTFSDNAIEKYVAKRISGRTPSGLYVNPDTIEESILHNGMVGSELKSYLSDNYGEFEEVVQENGKEPIFIVGQNQHIAQTSGKARRHRYERMFAHHNSVSEKKIPFRSLELNENSRETEQAYENNAYDFIVGMVVPDEYDQNGGHKYEDRRVFPSLDIKDISKIIIGSQKAVAKEGSILEKGVSEYMDSQIVELDGEKVLNLSDLYGDQANTIISKLLREFYSIAKNEGVKRKIEIIPFSRYGSLKHDLSHNDLFFPNGVVRESDLTTEEPTIYTIENIFAEDNRLGLILNVNNVLDETVEQLDLARHKNLQGVELELTEYIDAVNWANKWYSEFLDVNLSPILIASDFPLRKRADGEYDNLAYEEDTLQGEKNAVKKIKEAITKKDLSS